MPCTFKLNDEDHACGYNIAEAELYNFNGQQWCEFHLPMEDNNGNKSEKSEWGEEKISDFNQRIFGIINHVKELEDENKIASFRGVIFPGKIGFVNNQLPNIYFIGAIFNDVISFENATFTGFVSFAAATFKDDVIFNNATFIGDASFGGAVFNRFAYFEETAFSDKADFTRATSSNWFSRKTKFKKDAIFKEFFFSGYARFYDTSFRVDADFSGATFNGDAGFDRVTFNAADECVLPFVDSEITVSDAMKRGTTRFNNATFRKTTKFIDAKFRGTTRFNDATFIGKARFDNAKFLGDAWFDANIDQNRDPKDQSGNYFKNASFEKCKFCAEVSFINRRFLTTVSFNYCEFLKPPSFHNSELHQDTNFKGTVFNDTKSRHADRAYRTLKLAMEKTRARDEQARFYALEQQSIRNQHETASWVKLTSWLYEISSNYGQSALRPLVGLVVIFFFSWLIYFNALEYNTTTVKTATDIAFQQIVRPFTIWTIHRGDDSMKLFAGNNYAWIRYIAALQSILSLIFIALFILAIRWRYRRG